MRELELFNKAWRFREGDFDTEKPADKGLSYPCAKTKRRAIGPASYNYVDSPFDYHLLPNQEPRINGWKIVDLPHDYIISKTPEQKNNNALGFFEYTNAWYRKHFKLTEEDKNKRITVVFEGVTTFATVYINGCLVKHNFCGFTSFEVDITDYVFFDKDNVLAVYVNTDENECWWYQGGGIYRNVWLKKTDKVCIDMYGVYAKPVKLNENEWRVDFETTILNENYDGRAKRITARSEIKNSSGEVLAVSSASVLVGAKEQAVAKYSAVVKNPLIWDIDSPNLYTVDTVLIKNGNECDNDTVRIGFRTAVCDADKGFILNGKPVKIKGVCAHQDFGLTGLAVPENILRHKVKLIKEMGANGYRCSHYPHPAATMDALDEMGFIVMAETRWFESSDQGLEQLEMLIKRDRNRPSVFFWSIGNEEGYFNNDAGVRIAKSMYRAVKKLDTERQVLVASATPLKCKVFGEMDVVGLNYRLNDFDVLREQFKDKPFLSSECCAHSTTRDSYYFERDIESLRGYLSAVDGNEDGFTSGREYTWKHVMARDYIMGEYQWIAFEHRGEAYWPRLCSQSGAIDMYLQKKDAFYQNLSHWGSDPMVHLLPHWNWVGREGEIFKVYAYTNCDKVQLFLNGKSVGVCEIESIGHAEWEVPFEAGELKAVGYKNGKKVAEEIRKTSGKGYALKLKLENDNAKKPGDIALFTCYVVDENGIEVPDAEPFVHFYSNSKGKIVGTGSDVCDHVPVTVMDRKMRAGKISVAVMLKENQNNLLKLCAEADGLAKASISIEI